MATATLPLLGVRARPRQPVGQYDWLLYAFVIIQFLAPALFFVPGAQSLRFVIRALPYASSLLLLVWSLTLPAPKRLPAGATFMILALVLLGLNLCHPGTPPWAGLAQCVFQLSIVAPLFWGGRLVNRPELLQRFLWLIFLCNAASAVVGVLQVYAPQTFMPPEFSRVALAMNAEVVSSLTYRGADGREIVRPPGLSDMPGGASGAGMLAAFFGLVFGTQPRRSFGIRLLCFSLAGLGFLVLFMTQVRSLLMTSLIALLAMCALLLWQRRAFQALILSGLTALLLTTTFAWAVSLGGDSVRTRYLGLLEDGAVGSYQKNRGLFLEYTFNDLLAEYPLGAGVGRWGMMNYYFGRQDRALYPPLHVEIQVTGWLLDGGVPLWILYGGAIVLSLVAALRLALDRRDLGLAYAAAIVFCLCMLVLTQSFSGPSFNTQMGIHFWLLLAALHGAAAGMRPSTLLTPTVREGFSREGRPLPYGRG